MKGRKGGEGPQTGIAPAMPAPPSTGGSRIMAAAKRRKRGGRVQAATADTGPKVEGDMAMKRLDKPKRARGGGVDSNVARQRAKADSMVSDMMSKRASTKPRTGPEGEAALKSIEAKMRGTDKPNPKYDSLASSMGKPGKPPTESIDSALRSLRKPARARGGKVGADTAPFTHAKPTKATKGHSTQANIT